MTSMHSIRTANVSEVANFMKALHAAEPFEDVEQTLDVLSDAHKWEAEFGQWLAHGKPLSDEDAGFNAFEQFVQKQLYGEPDEAEAGDEADAA